MTQTFKCPACNAPLKFQKGLVQTCKFCGSDVIAPSGFGKSEEKLQEEIFEAKPITEAESLRNVSELGEKALKIAEIKQAIKGNRTTSAAILFRDSFGGSLADARDIIKAIESGESVNVPDFRADKKTSSKKWIVLFAILIIAIILFLIFGVKFFG